ncbi:MAG: 5-(carboxyamino)imidazole ribonucleotide synthase [Devosia nanyangense]|uniref:N5-carboxyaminoimidazole ribonucleotide synthase n=1 Tax=Devosia nanyangense TaxID=1228055 RepID=A0A933L5Y8_9HYPH|nr:5-(carboxyamino)imidazole ribonucleotide synthase [Devosia nanyangense]
MPEPLPLGSTIGILGGGQLGRMLALAAARLGFKAHIYCPDKASAAFDVTPRKTVAAYDDLAALAAFAAVVDVITYEFENVPSGTAEFLAPLKPLRPGANALAIAQDRLAEKTFIGHLGIPVAPHRPVHALTDLAPALASLGTPAILKTTRLGYDGKGQRQIATLAEAEAAFAELQPHPLVLEAFIPFVREISVVLARGLDGATAAFDPAANTHEAGILVTSSVPAAISPETATAAQRFAADIASALDYVGVLGVEFFVLADGSLIVNEMAPRVHNTGHWTEAVCVADQFEQHIRAIAGWPLGDPTRLADAVMENLIGDEIGAIPARLGPGIRPHAYGKAESRPGRKMGHLTRISIKSSTK